MRGLVRARACASSACVIVIIVITCVIVIVITYVKVIMSAGVIVPSSRCLKCLRVIDIRHACTVGGISNRPHVG